jgi:hypothetical protein
MEDVHSETETVPATTNRPARRRRIKLAWRKPELDTLIQLADSMALRNPELSKTQKTRATEAQAARAEYSTVVVNPEDQLPPKGFPKCLVREEYLNDLGELEVDALELSENPIELNTLNELLMKKLGNRNRMAVTG